MITTVKYEYRQNNITMAIFSSLEMANSHFIDQVNKYPRVKHEVRRVETSSVLLFEDGKHKMMG